jgi:type VI secretion system protein ImpH
MAASNWGTDCRLDESLFASGWEFEFFQAVRLLTRLHEERHPGASGLPAEIVRFRAYNSLAFPASAIASIEDENGGPPGMTVTFLGMTGPEGALPAAYTEIAIDRECFGDRSFAEFLDIFNDRLIRLFFEAWKKHHFFVGYEQSRQDKAGQDEFTSYLFDLIGLGTAGLRNRMPLRDIGLLHYAGLLAQRPHSAEALRAVVKDYFEVPVRVEQFRGQWHLLERDELCSLGSDQPSCQLGGGCVAGDAIWSRQILVRIILGPLTLEQFRAFLPDGDGFAQAASLIRWFLGSTLEFEMQPTLRRDEVPPCRLGDKSADGSRLGWSAWVGSEPFWPAASDAIFREEEQVSMEARYGTQ